MIGIFCSLTQLTAVGASATPTPAAPATATAAEATLASFTFKLHEREHSLTQILYMYLESAKAAAPICVRVWRRKPASWLLCRH